MRSNALKSAWTKYAVASERRASSPISISRCCGSVHTGHEAGLEAAEQRDRRVDDGAHLEQGAVAGRQAELEECGAEALGRLVEVRVGEATLLRDERHLAGVRRAADRSMSPAERSSQAPPER